MKRNFMRLISLFMLIVITITGCGKKAKEIETVSKADTTKEVSTVEATSELTTKAPVVSTTVPQTTKKKAVTTTSNKTNSNGTKNNGDYGRYQIEQIFDANIEPKKKKIPQSDGIRQNNSLSYKFLGFDDEYTPERDVIHIIKIAVTNGTKYDFNQVEFKVELLGFNNRPLLTIYCDAENLLKAESMYTLKFRVPDEYYFRDLNSLNITDFYEY